VLVRQTLPKEEILDAIFLFLTSFYGFLEGAKIPLTLLAGKTRVFLADGEYLYVMRWMSVFLGLFATLLLKTGFEL
jgi:hypothetical protein